MHLEGIGEDGISTLNMPTGIPLRYYLTAGLLSVQARRLGVSGSGVSPRSSGGGRRPGRVWPATTSEGEPDLSNHLRRRPGVAMVVGLRCGAGGRTVEPRRWGSPPTAVDADGLYLARMRVTAWPSLRPAAPSRDT